MIYISISADSPTKQFPLPGEQNPHQMHHTPSHNVTMQCGVSERLAINNCNTKFRQVQMSSLTAMKCINVINQLFRGRVISTYGDISWPATSPDLSACGSSVSTSNERRICISPTKYCRIRAQNSGIKRRGQTACSVPHRVVGNMRTRSEECPRKSGTGHLEDVVFKSAKKSRIRDQNFLWKWVSFYIM